MTSRELFILVLRGIGFWTVVRALGGISYAIANVLMVWDVVRSGQEWPDDLSTAQILLTSCVQPAVELVVGAFLLLGAVRISRFFYRELDAGDQAFALGLTPEDLYRTSAQVLGLYAFLWSVRPLSHVVATVARWEESARLSKHDVAQIVQAVLYLGCAFGMVFGAKRIARCLSKLRHVPGLTVSSATQRAANNGT
jgi:hypothetical protein